MQDQVYHQVGWDLVVIIIYTRITSNITVTNEMPPSGDTQMLQPLQPPALQLQLEDGRAVTVHLTMTTGYIGTKTCSWACSFLHI
jgi:hypothetical protein